MPKIRMTLDPDDIQRAISEVEAYREKVEKLGDTVTKRLTEDGVKQAQGYAMFHGAYFTGELVSGIVPEYHDGKGYVHSTAPHTALVEMGTGIKGKKEQNPNGTEPGGWEGYDIHNHGLDGWEYIGKDGKKHWTCGMPSRPFMYDTAQAIKQAVPLVVEDELKK